MENLRYLVIFMYFTVFWGVFAPILSYLRPKMGVEARNTTQGGV